MDTDKFMHEFQYCPVNQVTSPKISAKSHNPER